MCLAVPVIVHSAPVSTTPIQEAPVVVTSPGLISMVPNCQIGRITANIAFDTSVPNSYCIDDRIYMGAAVRIGRINLFRRPPAEAGVRIGTAMVSAQLKANLFNRLTPGGGCPKFQPKVYQFRDDWYADEGGYESTTIERLKGAKYLEATGGITPVELLQYTIPKRERKHRKPVEVKKSAPVAITLRNPFKTALNGLTLVLHYEGGRHKPMPRYEEVVVNLEPGQQMVKTVAIHKALPAGKNHETGWWRFVAASLEGTAGGCTFWPTTHRR
jgi:hypothetical protein